MRVALIAPEIPDYALEYAQVLAETSDVILFIPDKFRRSGMVHSPRLKIRWIPWPRQRSIRNVMLMIGISREIRIYQANIVHCLDSNYLWLNLLAVLLRSIPFVITVHDVCVHPGDGSTQRVPRSSVRALARKSTAVIVHGEALRTHAASAFSIHLERIFVFPHPPLTRYWQLASQAGFLKPNDNLFRILFFGRIQEYKGLSYLIAAAPIVRQKIPNAKFVIAGRGDFSAYRELTTDAACFEVHNRFISEIDTARMFAEANLLALPYIEASQSGVLLAALPFRLPVVATDIGEMGQIVRSTGIGFLVPSRDSNALASAIIEAASDPNSTRILRNNMDRLMHGNLSLQALSTQALLMYGAILKSQAFSSRASDDQ